MLYHHRLGFSREDALKRFIFIQQVIVVPVAECVGCDVAADAQRGARGGGVSLKSSSPDQAVAVFNTVLWLLQDRWSEGSTAALEVGARPVVLTATHNKQTLEHQLHPACVETQEQKLCAAATADDLTTMKPSKCVTNPNLGFSAVSASVAQIAGYMRFPWPMIKVLLAVSVRGCGGSKEAVQVQVRVSGRRESGRHSTRRFNVTKNAISQQNSLLCALLCSECDVPYTPCTCPTPPPHPTCTSTGPAACA